MRIEFVCIRRSILWRTEHAVIHFHTLCTCLSTASCTGALSPCLFLSLQFFNNQDDFTEDFTLFDIKLVLCTVACLFSLYALLYDYFIAPMPDSWPVLLVCSVRSALSSVCMCVYVTPSG